MLVDQLIALAVACAPAVHPTTALAVVRTESASNPHAIGVVGGRLDRQPRSRAEALVTARALRNRGWNFSVGVAQINVRNLDRLGMSLEDAFEPCTNLAAMQAVLLECLPRDSLPLPAVSQGDLRGALSCYWSGNFVTGFKQGYVRRVAKASQVASVQPQSLPTTSRETS